MEPTNVGFLNNLKKRISELNMENSESIDPIVVIPTTEIGENRVKWATQNIPKFCVLPWINLHTTPTGDIKLCCSIQYNSYIMKQPDVIFNLGYDDIEQIWNSGHMRFTREQHRTGNGISSCNECYKMEEVSGHSPRIGQNNEWLERQKTDEYTQKTLETTANNLIEDLGHMPISLELRLGNQCNLQCISCWGMSSSLIQDERKSLVNSDILSINNISEKYREQWKKEVKEVGDSDLRSWFESETFYNNMKKMAPNLRRLYTTGGEPTLIKANYKMMQLMLDAGNKECAIEFTSNMAVWNNEFYSRLEKFHNAEIQMSIDGMGIIGEYIRYPSNLAKVEENVFKAAALVATRPGWKLKCYTVLQGLNYRHLLPIWELLRRVADQYNIKINWWPITLYSPSFLGLAAISKEQRLAYAEEFKVKAQEFNSQSSMFRISPSTITPCIESMVNPEYSEHLNSKLKTYIEIMDKSRLKNGLEIFSREINNDA